MRIVGAVLIFTAFLAAGFTIISEKKRHKDDLSELCFALEIICSELGTKTTPLPELVSIIPQRTKGDVEYFFVLLKKSLPELGATPFTTLWEMAADCALSVLTAEELSELKKLGCIIGRYELSRQLTAAETALAYFHAKCESAGNRLPEERRLCLGISACAGAMLAILFI